MDFETIVLYAIIIGAMIGIIIFVIDYTVISIINHLTKRRAANGHKHSSKTHSCACKFN
jgi:hypothetical protein